MKKFVLLFALVCFSFVIANAQGNKVTNCYTYPMINGTLVCNGDIINGEVSICTTNWENKNQTQFRIKALYVGNSGSVYELSGVQNIGWKPYVPGTAYTFTNVFTDVIYCDGVEFAIMKTRAHFTMNASGEIVVDNFEVTDWVCL